MSDETAASGGFDDLVGPVQGKVEAKRLDADDARFETIGDRLAGARRELGLSVRDVSDATRVRVEALDAIEAMDPRRLPEGPYAIGFVRTYAAFLNVDPDRAVARFRKEMHPKRVAAPKAEKQQKKPVRITPQAAGLTLAALGLGAAIWVGLRPHPTELELRVPPVPEALEDWVAAEPGGAAARRAMNDLAVVEGPEISLEAKVADWIEVRGPDRSVVFAGEFEAGQVYAVPRLAGLRIAVRNGGAWEALVDGRLAGRLAEPGVPVTGWPVDRARATLTPLEPPVDETQAPTKVEPPAGGGDTGDSLGATALPISTQQP